MAGKNLYEILEVGPNATAEMVSAAYRFQCERLEVAKRDPETAAVLRQAVDEAYHTLSNPHARGRYDLKIRQPVFVASAVTIDDSSWFARNWMWLTIVVAIVGGGGYFYDRNKKERMAAEQKLAEQKGALERERAERAAEDARRAAAAAAVEAHQQRTQEFVWQEQTRARARADQMRRVQTEDRDRQLAERQKLMDERREQTERLRQENEARMNLEREKAKLRQLECARGPC